MQNGANSPSWLWQTSYDPPPKLNLPVGFELLWLAVVVAGAALIVVAAPLIVVRTGVIVATGVPLASTDTQGFKADSTSMHQ